MQFRLQTLLLLFVVFWSSLAAFGGAGGIAVFVLAIAVALFLNNTDLTLALLLSKVRDFHVALVFLLGVMLFVYLLLPRVGSRGEPPQVEQCRKNLGQIAVALHEYHQAYNCFPPASISDKNGRPMHSWRVLILPYLDQKKLYDQYDFNEPWNGPHNSKLLAARPPVYVCPSDQEAQAFGAARTSYVAVVGTHAAWGKAKPRSLNDPELANCFPTTILVAETASRIEWSEPKDICLDALGSSGTSSDSVTLSSKHGCYWHDLLYDYEDDTPTTACVMLLDGSTRLLLGPYRFSSKLPSLLKIDGFREDAINAVYKSPESMKYRFSEPKATLRWRHWAAVAVWIASVGLLLYRARRSRRPRDPQAAGPQEAVHRSLENAD